MALSLFRRGLVLGIAAFLVGCSSSDGDTTIINQDVVPADPPVKVWRIAEALSVNNAGSAQPSVIQFDAAGNAIALFVENGVWSRRWTPGTGWGDLVRISELASPYGREPKLGVDAAGNAIAVYSQYDDPSGTISSIWWNQYTANVGWAAPVLLESDDVDSAAAPVIAMDGAGNAVAAWSTSDGLETDLWFNRYVAGTGWEGADVLDDGPDPVGEIRLGADATGDVLAVWNRSAATSDIIASRYTPGTGWSAFSTLNAAGLSSFSPELAVNAAGRGLAVWLQYDGVLLVDLMAAEFIPGSGWGAPGLAENNDTDMMLAGQVVLDSAGAGTVVWMTSDLNLGTARFSPTGGWTGHQQLAPLMNGSEPRLAISASGTTGVVWSHSDGIQNNILFAGHSGGPWSNPVYVEYDDYYAQGPVLAMDANGNALALWSSYDAVTGFRTWANRYE